MSKDRRNNLEVSIEWIGNKWWGGEVVDSLALYRGSVTNAVDLAPKDWVEVK